MQVLESVRPDYTKFKKPIVWSDAELASLTEHSKEALYIMLCSRFQSESEEDEDWVMKNGPVIIRHVDGVVMRVGKQVSDYLDFLTVDPFEYPNIELATKGYEFQWEDPSLPNCLLWVENGNQRSERMYVVALTTAEGQGMSIRATPYLIKKHRAEGCDNAYINAAYFLLEHCLKVLAVINSENWPPLPSAIRSPDLSRMLQGYGVPKVVADETLAMTVITDLPHFLPGNTPMGEIRISVDEAKEETICNVTAPIADAVFKIRTE